MKQHISFIINPNSGVKRKKNAPKAIAKHLDLTKFNYDILYTKAARHAITLTKKAIANGADIVAAVGGDGSINEVAQSLIETDKTLAILPHGSGNGFAMHTDIGRNIVKAINIINTGKIVCIDTCMMNDQPFLNLAGFGFDGLIANKLQQARRRGFMAYFQIIMKEIFAAKFHDFKIYLDDEPPFERAAFLMEIGNGPMFGYGFTIVPTSNLTDGTMHVLLIKKANKLKYLPKIHRLLKGTVHESGKLVESYQATKIKIDFDAPMPAHFDGEGFIEHKNSVTFQIKPKSLKVILPQNGKY